MQWIKLSSLLLGLLTVAALLAGCGATVVDTLTPVPTPLPPVIAPPVTLPPVATEVGAVTIAPQYAALGVGGVQQFTGTVAGGGGLSWSVNGVPGGNAVVGTVDASGNYTAPATLAQSENVVVTAASTVSPQTAFATAVMSLIVTGVVAATGNPQVATYVIYLPMAGQMQVDFGLTTSNQLPTWQQSTPSANGGQVTMLVAGMLGNSPYHMHAQVTLADGATFTDVDHTFMTGTPPGTAKVTTTVTGTNTPQPGIELFDTLQPPEQAQGFATDLKGNVIWTYSYAGTPQDGIQPIKLLPNGHFLVQISYLSSISLKGGKVDAGSLDEVREVDLAGNTIRSLTQAQLAASLTAEGYTFQLGSLHHDVLALPNGHMVLLATVIQTFNNLTGYPGALAVQGDLLVDVDQNFKPDWVWNAFDHLDVNRHPYQFPDWTHANDLLYSADDHNLLLSIRHQNWLIKIDFNDGAGAGDVVWKLGEGGDFQLQGGVDPTDWFYAQHGPGYFSTNTTGTFLLGVMDNGDDRVFPTGVKCGVNSGTPCLYSSAMVLQVNEAAKTALLVEHDVQPVALYSFFGGNVELLANGDLEADFCAAQGGTVVQELHGFEGANQVVWQAVTTGANQYRAERLPSLYPGVQW